MADASAPVNNAAQQPLANPGATTGGEDALPKNPFADTQTSKPSEAAASSVPKSLPLTPEVHNPADTPAATANGGSAAPSITSDAPAASATNGNGVNGSGSKFESLAPEETKQTSATAAAPATEKPAPSTFSENAPGSSAKTTQPPVMTGALPPGDQSNSTAPVPNPAGSAEKDGVEDITGASAASKLSGPTQTESIKDASVGSTANSDAPQSSLVNGTEKKDDGIDTAAAGTALVEKKDDDKKDPAPTTALPSTEESSAAAPIAEPVEEKDVEMKDAAPIPASEKPSAPAPTAVPVTAPATDISGVTSTTGAPTTTPALATPSTAAAEATGGKRKAETNTEEATEEPAAKKQKGAFSRAIDKAKDAVKGAKEKAKPGRKPGKREKKEIAPVGRTERKTRSQARAE